MASWNEGGFKVGLCRVAPAGQPRAVLGLFNSTAVAGALDEQRGRFERLFKRRAHLHHYTEFMAEAEMAAARDNVVGLVAEYEAVGSATPAARVEHPLDRAVPLR
jgi:tubulin epsilon